tara:strand:+ start:10304 stop:10885 length:582 start_codon:yes stop_codon:yes gene_type:complete
MNKSKNIPEYLDNNNFDQTQLNNLLTGTNVTENIDDSGNLIVDMNKEDINNNITLLKQNITEFSNDKIEQNYDTSFNELINESDAQNNVMVEEDIKQLSEDQLKRESVLENQLDELANVLERESQRNIKIQEDAETNYNAMKSVILEQRIKNGEGVDEADFSDSFPFLPKREESSEQKNETSYNPSPFAIEPT